MSAAAAMMARLPEAQAASWREAGMPVNRSSVMAKKPPSIPCPVNRSPTKLPTWPTSMSSGSRPVSAKAPRTASAKPSPISSPSRA